MKVESDELYIVVDRDGHLLDYVLDDGQFECDLHQAILLNMRPIPELLPRGAQLVRVSLRFPDEQN